MWLEIDERRESSSFSFSYSYLYLYLSSFTKSRPHVNKDEGADEYEDDRPGHANLPIGEDDAPQRPSRNSQIRRFAFPGAVSGSGETSHERIACQSRDRFHRRGWSAPPRAASRHSVNSTNHFTKNAVFNTW